MCRLLFVQTHALIGVSGERGERLICEMEGLSHRSFYGRKKGDGKKRDFLLVKPWREPSYLPAETDRFLCALFLALEWR